MVKWGPSAFVQKQVIVKSVSQSYVMGKWNSPASSECCSSFLLEQPSCKIKFAQHLVWNQIENKGVWQLLRQCKDVFYNVIVCIKTFKFQCERQVKDLTAIVIAVAESRSLVKRQKVGDSNETSTNHLLGDKFIINNRVEADLYVVRRR